METADQASKRVKGEKKYLEITNDEAGRLLEQDRNVYVLMEGEGSDGKEVYKQIYSRMDVSQVWGNRLFTDAPTKETQRVQISERVRQINEWLGTDTDAPIIFDESHAMRNTFTEKDKKPSKRALAGLHLRELNPKARIAFFSATGATEAENLGYLERLGLWGDGTAFSGAADFISKVKGAGLAMMELVAQNMKQMGVYLSRSLSYDQVNYHSLPHVLPDHQRAAYNIYADAWQGVLANFERAMDATLQNKNKEARRAYKAQFWGSQQRFFNMVISSIQMPTTLAHAKEMLAAGHSPVFSLKNTNESMAERQKALMAKKAEEEGLNTEDEEFDFSPKQILVELMKKSWPVEQYETYRDDKGNELSRPVLDSKGNPVLNRAEIAKRDAAIAEVEKITMPDNPLDQIIETFGSKNVAEVSGRKSRFERYTDEHGNMKMREVRRTGKSNDAETNAFMDDKKKVMV
ncbi:MAG: strawberry notch-like NTP hydrolase domain-containing protein, partial [Terriglobia bacterium]